MRRRLLPAIYALAAACTPTHQRADIEYSDASSRYPAAVRETREGFARLAAVALVLYIGCLVVERLRRPAGERRVAPAATAGAFVGLLVAASVVVQTAGPYPQGLVYRAAVDGSFVLPWVMALGGVGWLIERETAWGLFHVLGGVVLFVFAAIAGIPVWDCC